VDARTGKMIREALVVPVYHDVAGTVVGDEPSGTARPFLAGPFLCATGDRFGPKQSKTAGVVYFPFPAASFVGTWLEAIVILAPGYEPQRYPTGTYGLELVDQPGTRETSENFILLEPCTDRSKPRKLVEEMLKNKKFSGDDFRRWPLLAESKEDPPDVEVRLTGEQRKTLRSYLSRAYDGK